MLTGICLNCETTYKGWALSKERHQICPKCGSLIKVTEYGKIKTQNGMCRERVLTEERPRAGKQRKSASKTFGKRG